MNNSTATDFEQIGISDVELWIHLAFFYGFLCGIVTTMGNILIIIGLLRIRALRRPFLITVGALTICRILLCLQFLVMACYRILRQLEMAPFMMTRISCHSVQFWLIIGLSLEMLYLLALVVDRSVAILVITIYENYSSTHAIIFCTLMFFIAILIKLPPSYIGISFQEIIPCVNSYSAPSDQFNEYSMHIDLSLLITILVFYFFLLVYVKYRFRDGRVESETANMSSVKKELDVMPTLRNLVFAHGIFAIISKILRTLAGSYHQDHPVSARFTAYGGLFNTIDLFCNMLTLLFSNQDIKRAAARCLWKEKNQGNLGKKECANSIRGNSANLKIGEKNSVNKIGENSSIKNGQNQSEDPRTVAENAIGKNGIILTKMTAINI